MRLDQARHQRPATAVDALRIFDSRYLLVAPDFLDVLTLDQHRACERASPVQSST